MSKILLVDADSTIPNLPLMKLSTYHKQKGDTVSFRRLDMPYYPNREKPILLVPDGTDTTYDMIYCSVIFEGNKEYIYGENIIFGGTGHDLSTTLPDDIESLDCDYSLYPENKTSYGFITRGCIRSCSFCKVPKKEGTIRMVNTIKNIVRHKKVKFLDNNILAYPDHYSILQELADTHVLHQFNQGLDIRLVDETNSTLLSQLNYLGEYIFAFDDWRYLSIIDEKLQLLDWRKDWQFKFFVYIHPSMPIAHTIQRIQYLKSEKCLPYIMRDISCWADRNSDFYTDVAAYCNQVSLFKSMGFLEFLTKRHTDKHRIAKSASLWMSAP